MKNYLNQASGWYYERYLMQKLMAKWSYYACIILSIACVALVILVACLLPLQKVIPLPIVVNEQNQVVKTINPKSDYVPINEAMVQNDIVRFIRNRESYNAKLLNYQIRNIAYTSTRDIFLDYQKILSSQNKESLVNTLGAEGTIDVKIHDVVFLETKDKPTYFKYIQSNIVQVDFSTVTKNNMQDIKENWVAILSFDYKGIPTDEVTAWENWNGFVVTSYRVNKREV